MARDVVRESVRKWRDELINLARSNRLLYFRHTKTSTLEIEDPGPQAVFERLGEVGKSGWRFYIPPEPAEEGEEPPPEKPRRWDELLTTKSDPKSINSALRNLERRATQEFMDKGLWILYLGIGMLEWLDPADEETAESPLVLVPVRLHRESPRDPYMLHRAEEDPVINPALSVKLANEFGVDLPVLEDVDELNPQQILKLIEDRVSGRAEWRVRHRAILGCFSFYKEVMYRDLIENEEAICAHDLVRALALGARAEVELDFDPVPEERLDELVPPEESVAILDADASQRQCIAAAKSGHSFVTDGPPGTGKSQTISNIISELLFQGKTILFVSEKAAALDVVHKRLAAAGLGEYLLELHSHKATRKEVAQELGRSLVAHPKPRTGLTESDVERLVARRKELSGYAKALNEYREPLGRTLHQVIGRVSELQKFPQAPVAASLTLDLKAEDVADLLGTAGALARSWGPVARTDTFHWRDLVELDASAARKRELSEQTQQALEALYELERATNATSSETGLGWRTTFRESALLLKILDHLMERMAVVPTWLTAGDFDSIEDRVAELSSLAKMYDDAASTLSGKIGQGWRSIDPVGNGRVAKATANLTGRSPAFSVSDESRFQVVTSLSGFLGQSAATFDNTVQKIPLLIKAFGLKESDPSLARTHEIAKLGLDSGGSNLPEPGWFNPSLMGAIQEGARVLGALVQQCREKQMLLNEVFNESVLRLDLEGLVVRFESVHRGFAKLRSAYRADKGALRAASRTGKVNKKVISHLRAALEWQRLQKELASAEQAHANVLGQHYYRGINTDFAAVTAAIDVAKRALELAGDQLKPEIMQRQLSRTGSPDAIVLPIATELHTAISTWRREAEQALGPLAVSLTNLSLTDLLKWCKGASADLTAIAAAQANLNEVSGSDIELGAARHLLAAREEAHQSEHQIRDSFLDDQAIIGPMYEGLSTDWPTLMNALRWTRDLRELCKAPVNARVADKLLTAEASPELLRSTQKSWIKSRDQLVSNFLDPRRDLITTDLDTTFDDCTGLLEEMGNSVDDVTEWMEFVRNRDRLSEAGLEGAVTFCIDRHLPSEQVAPVIERSILERWVDGTLKTDPRLRTFRAEDRDEYVSEFLSLDRDLVDRAAGRVIEACNQRRPRTNVGVAAVIEREAHKQRRHMPIRNLLDQTASVSQALKPCFMMSPLSVSQFLPPSARFDVVIFDEASQVRPSDAINCIYRGQQLIVAGDQKQLPPTSFFERVWLDEGDEYTEDQLEEFESVLDLAKGSGGFKSLSLRWHYRSQHEGLITFSNYSFYDGRLITFPSSTESAADIGIEFFKVDGVYRRGGPRDNPLEAVKVAERVLFHARNHPNLSLGVVAFSEAQAAAIEVELERQTVALPELDKFFAEDRLTGFFIKNLENVQGDERDIIIFSIGYGPDEAGKFTLQFGPINKSGGQRRLNVAVTRARRRVEVISSVTASQFQGEMTREGVRHLKRYLDYAERGLPALALELTESGGDVESPFEASVASLIRSWGFDVVPQVGCADYRIDLGVRDPARPGSFALGIECDGVMYHSSKVARDRDRLRQEVLEGLGWKLHRIWGTAWYSDRAKQEVRLRRAIEDAVSSGPALSLTHKETIRVREAESELERIDLNGPPEWAVEYRTAQVSAKDRHWLELHDPSAQPELRRLIEKVVAVEGPVAEEVVLRRIREAWGLGRAGSRIREAFEQALRGVVRTGKVKRDPQGFLWASGQYLRRVRVAVQGLPETRRAVDEVPQAEIEMAIRRLVADARSISWGDLATTVARIFGWARKGSDISDALDQAIDELLSGGALKQSGDKLEPTDITVPGEVLEGTEKEEDGVATCPSCGTRNNLPNRPSGELRCGNCHAPLPY